jgi:hypothetical protein
MALKSAHRLISKRKRLGQDPFHDWIGNNWVVLFSHQGFHARLHHRARLLGAAEAN